VAERPETQLHVVAPPSEPSDDELERLRQENRTLYAVINTVASSLDVDRVLDGIVGIATEATACHACFVYFVEGDRLALRAASPVYRRFVGRLSFGLDEGVTGWVARTGTPEFIREGLLADPRVKYVPELEEERFQSMVAVPVVGRKGAVIGVIVLHTAAPREFDDDVLNFLVHTASLVAGAIENAQLYAGARRRVDALTGLAALGQRVAGITRREDLYEAIVGGVRELLGVDACYAYRVESERGDLVLAACTHPDGAAPRQHVPATGVLLDLLRGESAGRLAEALAPDHDGAPLLAAPLVVSDEYLGILCARAAPGHDVTEEERGLFRAVAELAAVALKKSELIERLTAETLIKDTFDAIATGAYEAAEAKATAAGFPLGRPHLFVDVQPSGQGTGSWPEAAVGIEEHLRRLFPHLLVDARPDGVRAIVAVDDGADDAALEAIRARCGKLADGEVVVGISGVAHGAGECGRRMREAADAATIARALRPPDGAMRYDDLGAYKYLVHLDFERAPHDRYWAAIELLLDYDLRRQTHLVDTLEQFLRDRRSVAASARALYVHPNTLRQRLRRIEQLSGLDVASEDLLSLELAVKLVRLQHARRSG
jgi:GAF domain-containing protein